MKAVFPIIPASNGAMIMAVLLSALLMTIMALFAYFAYSSKNVRFEASAEGLRIIGDMYGRFIPIDRLRLNEAKVIDLNREPEYRFRTRTNGVALPGYRSGWFSLANKTKALVFVTDKSRVLCIPTTQGYILLLSVRDGEGLLAALRNT